MPGSSDAQAPDGAGGSAAPQATGRGLPIVVLRGVQFGLDLAISALLCLVPMSVLLVLPRNPDGTLGALLVSIPVLGLALLLAVVLSWWYWSALAARRGGRTLAMGWLGLRVIGPDGQPAGAAAMTLRWLGLAVDAILFGVVGLAAMLLTPRSQRVGDLLAATEVVRAGAR